MMGAEPGRPNELSPITRIDTARVRPVQSAAGRSFIEPGSPWQNPFVESFGSRVRDLRFRLLAQLGHIAA